MKYLWVIVASTLFGSAVANIKVTADGNVTLPTIEREQKISKIPIEKRVVNQTDALLLSCSTTTTLPRDLRVHYWKFKGETVKVKKEDDLVVFKKFGSSYTLILRNPGVDDIGQYVCGVSVNIASKSKTYVNVFSPPIIQMQKEDVSLRQKEGDSFRLRCRAKLWPVEGVKVTWYKDGFTNALESTPDIQISTTSSAENATVDSYLNFLLLRMDDRGVYFCRVTNKDGESDTMGWYLRVLDPLAPIWPLIGIILEVIVVVIIIVVYEWNLRKRRQAKKAVEAEHAAALVAASEVDHFDKIWNPPQLNSQFIIVQKKEHVAQISRVPTTDCEVISLSTSDSTEGSGHTRQRPAKV